MSHLQFRGDQDPVPIQGVTGSSLLTNAPATVSDPTRVVAPYGSFTVEVPSSGGVQDRW